MPPPSKPPFTNWFALRSARFWVISILVVISLLIGLQSSATDGFVLAITALFVLYVFWIVWLVLTALIKQIAQAAKTARMVIRTVTWIIEAIKILNRRRHL